MSEVYRMMTMRSDKSFENLQYGLSAHRHLFVIKDGMIEGVVLPELTHAEACDMIAASGECSVIESFMDPNTGSNVIRAKVLANGIDHYVTVIYDVLYEHLVKAALTGVKHSRIKTDG